jgi:hypothetical protein
LEEKKELIHPFSKRERGRRKEIKRNIHLLQKERKVGGEKNMETFQRSRFLCIFNFLACLKKPVSARGDLLQRKVAARLYWDLLTSGRY